MVILMTPTILQTIYGFPAATALKANSTTIVFLSVGCIAAGALADRFGAGWVFLLGSAGLLISSGRSITSSAAIRKCCSRCMR